MLTGIGSTIPRIANLPGSSRPGGGGGGPFEYTAIDNTYSMEFDGTGYIKTNVVNTGNEVSVGFWIKSSSTGTRQVLGASSVGLLRYFGFLGSTDQRLFIYDFGAWKPVIGGVRDGQWHHCVLVYDNSTKEIKGYKDGVLDSTVTFLGTYSDLGFQSIGRYALTDQRYLIGSLDEIALWNTKLSEGTIEAIYNTTNDNPGKAADLSETPEGAPVAWYRMGD